MIETNEKRVNLSGVEIENGSERDGEKILGSSPRMTEYKISPRMTECVASGMTKNVESGMTVKRGAGMTEYGASGKDRNTSSESGKSMVEMLGVLAIMGLLAVLGAKGYEAAMERVAANNIINEVSRRSVAYSQQMMTNAQLSSLNHSEFSDIISGNFKFDSYLYGSLFFKIDVQNVDQAICRHIGKNGYKKAIKITANNKDLTTTDQSGCGTGSNTVSFIFNKSLGQCEGCLNGVKTCVGQSGCSANQVCENNLCVCAPQYSCGSKCCDAGQSCINGQCTAANACGDGVCETGVCENGACICHSWKDNCPYFCMMSNKSTGVCSTNPYLAQGADTNDGGVVWSSRTLNWFAAKDFCESEYNGKKHMVTFEELGCVKINGVQNWNCSNIKAEYKNKGQVWVADQWKNDDEAWFVNTNSGAVGSYGWVQLYAYYALCR